MRAVLESNFDQVILRLDSLIELNQARTVMSGVESDHNHFIETVKTLSEIKKLLTSCIPITFDSEKIDVLREH